MDVHWRFIPAARNSYAALYAACEQEGYILEPVRTPAPDVTCYSLNSLTASRYLPEIRDAPCITIVGGPHATARTEEMARIADYVVVGEGEFVLPALLRSLESGGPVPPGVATKEGFSPAPHCVRLDAYPPFSTMKGYIEISRGCPHACAYCQTPRIFGPHMRHRSIDAVTHAARRFRDARFVTPNALAYGSDGRTPRLEKVESLLSSLRHEEQHIYFGTFPSEVRPEWVTREAIDLITTYCSNTRLHFGAQSGSDRVLSSLHRGHTVQDVISAVELCLDAGLTPVVDFIVGIPGEEEDDQRMTARLVEWISRRGRVHLHRFIPLPGTPMEKTAPQPLLPEVERLLGALALRGRVTGSWGDPTRRFF
ncbi:MAG: coproporphyrinogen III oxidase [Methanoregulaceae archaeon PtaB.Bin009]|jgi:B12-binding domain/radical SAM domain protein|nr:MAG: coproporphyrinogen III oxidase [Methanoregulaceae archaeon PtaB.Bin009]OPY41104.1 MAG: coproporphyrinogen III oxidase [Methanoregulaceae archaeon PtaU1.Bin066]HNQ29160.1 TIGR04013 family B12-binding domain/radical SAM domain-containing protein [Methanolinea sp.]